MHPVHISTSPTALLALPRLALPLALPPHSLPKSLDPPVLPRRLRHNMHHHSSRIQQCPSARLFSPAGTRSARTSVSRGRSGEAGDERSSGGRGKGVWCRGGREVDGSFGELQPRALVVGRTLKEEGRTKDRTPSIAPRRPPSLPRFRVQITTQSTQVFSGSASRALMNVMAVRLRKGETER